MSFLPSGFLTCLRAVPGFVTPPTGWEPFLVVRFLPTLSAGVRIISLKHTARAFAPKMVHTIEEAASLLAV